MSRSAWTVLVVSLAAVWPRMAAGQAARNVEPVVLTGATVASWSRLPAVTVCAPYPSGTTGGRDAHNGTTTVPPDARPGVPVNEIVAYRWTGLAFQEIPVQVDQRFTYCLSNPPSSFSFYSGTDQELTYAWDVESWKKTDGQCTAAYPPGGVRVARVRDVAVRGEGTRDSSAASPGAAPTPARPASSSRRRSSTSAARPPAPRARSTGECCSLSCTAGVCD